RQGERFANAAVQEHDRYSGGTIEEWEGVNVIGSNWTDKVNKGILQLQEQGALQALYMKYWKDRSKCPDTTKQFDQPQLDLPHLGGIFVALGISIFLALLIAFVEVFLYVRKRDLTQSLSEALVGEFRQIFGLAGSLPSDRQVLTENSS
ncbi:unnamed protein product, partial [Darwinula stevensoni]